MEGKVDLVNKMESLVRIVYKNEREVKFNHLGNDKFHIFVNNRLDKVIDFSCDSSLGIFSTFTRIFSEIL